MSSDSSQKETTNQYTHPEYLISIDQLKGSLDDPGLRIFDTAVHLKPQPGGSYQVDSGIEIYQQQHIPGAGFIDLVSDWADSTSKLNFTLPDLASLQQAIARSGIAADSKVVLYSSGHLMWATRAWWLLYHAGHRNVSILNGNFTAWLAAGYPVETGLKTYPETEFEATPATTQFATTAEVEEGMGGAVCTINALTQTLYEGTGEFYYTRPGHIPGSKLLFYDDVLEDEHFLAPEQLAVQLEKQGMLSAERVITYCGGGIAATLDAFACVLLGQENVAVYDGSMSEWVQDENRPLTTGSNP